MKPKKLTEGSAYGVDAVTWNECCDAHTKWLTSKLDEEKIKNVIINTLYIDHYPKGMEDNIAKAIIDYFKEEK